MPVSAERLAQIRELSNDERVDGIDASGFSDEDWAQFEAALDKETSTFCRETTDPEELHAFASTWNWDKGVSALEELLANPACEAATALLLFWGAAPEFYLQYADREAVEAAQASVETFDFIMAVQRRYCAGEFRAGVIAFDPANPEDGPQDGLSMTGVYDDMRDQFVRALPAEMYIPVKRVTE